MARTAENARRSSTMRMSTGAKSIRDQIGPYKPYKTRALST